MSNIAVIQDWREPSVGRLALQRIQLNPKMLSDDYEYVIQSNTLGEPPTKYLLDRDYVIWRIASLLASLNIPDKIQFMQLCENSWDEINNQGERQKIAAIHDSAKALSAVTGRSIEEIKQELMKLA